MDIDRIFCKLKNKKIVESARKLEKYTLGEDKFPCLRKNKIRGSIQYKKEHLDGFSEDEIIFMILHEEGHFRHFGLSDVGVGSAIIFSKFKLLFLGKNNKKRLNHTDEFLADLWSCSVMSSKLKMSNSEIFKIFKSCMTKLSNHKFTKYEDGEECLTHPSRNSRVEKIKGIYGY